MHNKTVFIDRDGTINVNVEYLDNPDEFRMYPTVAQGIKLLNKHGFTVIIITNQSGIARGYFSEKTLQEIHQKMNHELSKEGAIIDAIYYCPHHPNDNCDCRKPKTGLFTKAIKDFNIDIKHSYLIGDRMLDVCAGHTIGCKTILVPEDKKKVKLEMNETDIKPDYICDEFYSGVQWILKDSGQ